MGLRQVKRVGGSQAERPGQDGGSGLRLAERLVAVLALGLLLTAGTMGANARSRTGVGTSISRARFLMGSPLSIETAGDAAEIAIEAAFVEVERLDAILSNWREDSELSRLNANAARRPVICSVGLFAAVQSAVRWAEWTGGAFDPTVEPLVRELGIRGPEGRLGNVGDGGPALPNPPGAVIGHRRIRLDTAVRSVAFTAAGVGLDLGGIGKGIALDAAAKVLRAHGIEAALLDFGGQLLVFGKGPDDGGWRVALADPGDRRRAGEIYVIRHGSLSTSGQSERGREAAGGPPGHILDPVRGVLAPYDGTVTVLAKDATSADALSTALFVMGPDRGESWAKAHGVEVLFQSRDADGRRVRRGTGSLFNNPEADEAADSMARGGEHVRN